MGAVSEQEKSIIDYALDLSHILFQLFRMGTIS